jgi:endonuclease-3
MTDCERAAILVARLENLYPDARCTLNFKTAHELLVSAILAAQCTDLRVNQITPALFARYQTPEAFADADLSELEDLIRSCGLYRTKARAIKASCAALVRDYGGQMPDNLQELTRLPGVGRKIANLILGDWFGRQTVVVDTHCARIAWRLGLTDQKQPAAIERDLEAVLPPDRRSAFGHLAVNLGRDLCQARYPACLRCPLQPLCRYGQSA